MPIKLSSHLLAKVLNVSSRGRETQLSGIQFSSSEIRGGEIFLALKGETRHGHEFVADALARGAGIALVEDQSLVSTFGPDKVLAVPDTYAALSTLAVWWRSKLGAKCLAITGSAGKTTVKELCGALLSSLGKCTFAKKSFNNHIGLPYSICQADLDSDYLVLEIGMNHPGEISPLARIANADVTVVTSIGPAHIEAFDDIQGIVREKLAIRDGTSGPLILNWESSDLKTGVSALSEKDRKRVLKFGVSEECELRILSSRTLGVDGSTATISHAEESAELQLKLFGRGNLLNAACALLAVKTLEPKAELTKLCEILKELPAPPMRLNLFSLSGGRRLLDDGYNANPLSMQNSIETARELLAPSDTLCCIFGEMRELGHYSKTAHLEIGKLLATIPNLKEVIALGDDARDYLPPLEARADVRTIWTADPEEAATLASQSSCTFFLAKGSRGGGVERRLEPVVRKLRA